MDKNNKHKPNILIVYADQHRYDCLGVNGNKDIRTPNIDTLASDGVNYRNCFCSFPICTPSRYSFLSGLYVHQHTGWDNHCTLPQGIDTFPKILKEAGYNTKAVGKMHFTPTYLDVGFQEMELAEQDGAGRYVDDYHEYLRSKGLIDRTDLLDQVKEYRETAPKEYWNTYGTIGSNLDEEDYSTTWIGDRAVESLEKWGEDGNLLMVGFIKPHHPFDAPEPWKSMYDATELSLLPGWTEKPYAEDIEIHKGYFPHSELTEAKLKKVMACYYASISQMDYHVGRMIDKLKEKGLYNDTLIIYTGDHGEYMGFHHLLLKNNYMYDPVVKVPLIIKYPQGIRGGEVTDVLVNSLDVTTTIIKQADCEASRLMQGADLSKDFTGRSVVYAERLNSIEYMVRTRTRKLLLCKQYDKSKFYDLEKDPLEYNNLFNDSHYKTEIDEHIKLLCHWILFEAASYPHLDENAPVISPDKKGTVLCRDRKTSMEYFNNKIKIE